MEIDGSCFKLNANAPAREHHRTTYRRLSFIIMNVLEERQLVLQQLSQMGIDVNPNGMTNAELWLLCYRKLDQNQNGMIRQLLDAFDEAKSAVDMLAGLTVRYVPVMEEIDQLFASVAKEKLKEETVANVDAIKDFLGLNAS